MLCLFAILGTKWQNKMANEKSRAKRKVTLLRLHHHCRHLVMEKNEEEDWRRENFIIVQLDGMTVVLCARIGGFVATRFHPIKHCRSSIRAIL